MGPLRLRPLGCPWPRRPGPGLRARNLVPPSRWTPPSRPPPWSTGPRDERGAPRARTRRRAWAYVHDPPPIRGGSGGSRGAVGPWGSGRIGRAWWRASTCPDPTPVRLRVLMRRPAHWTLAAPRYAHRGARPASSLALGGRQRAARPSRRMRRSWRPGLRQDPAEPARAPSPLLSTGESHEVCYRQAGHPPGRTCALALRPIRWPSSARGWRPPAP